MTLVRQFIRALLKDGQERGETLDLGELAKSVRNDFPEHSLQDLIDMIRDVAKTITKS